MGFRPTKQGRRKNVSNKQKRRKQGKNIKNNNKIIKEEEENATKENKGVK